MQCFTDTFCSVRNVPVVLHNSCMSKAVQSMDAIAVLAGRRITTARKRRGWSQEDLSKATGWTDRRPSRAQANALSFSRIANYEQGTRRVGPEEARILARVFGDHYLYFMGLISEQESAVLVALQQINEGPDGKPTHHDGPFSP
jgi:transcriptional regulator with XRE-family HTH domain